MPLLADASLRASNARIDLAKAERIPDVKVEALYHRLEATKENTVGVVSVKAIYANLAAGVGVNLKDLMISPLIVPESQTVLQLVETFEEQGYIFEVLDMDRHRVDKVLVLPAKQVV